MVFLDKKSLNRFFSKIRKTKSCWIWIGRKHRQGYGFFTLNGKDELAHRVSYSLRIIRIPRGKMVCHHCDNPSCVRPEHLFLGTQKDNMQDMIKKGRGADVRGEKNPRNILTVTQVVKLKRMLKSQKYSYKELAKKFGISYGEVNNIVSGYSWKNIKP